MDQETGTELKSYHIEVRGLKLCLMNHDERRGVSYPIEVRGLKQRIKSNSAGTGWSHPLRMRHVPFSERSNHHRFNRLRELVSLPRITILSIIINKIQTTTKENVIIHQ